jgi:hypothetical protein
MLGPCQVKVALSIPSGGPSTCGGITNVRAGRRCLVLDPAWQAKEREADVQIRTGQGIEFSCVEDFIDHLKLLDQEAAAER